MKHLILETSSAHEWIGRNGLTLPPLGAPLVIPPARRPTVLHGSREQAEQEALRLAAEHPGAEFVVFAPVCVGKTVKVPTHTTDSGKVYGERGIASLLQIAEEDLDDDLPF